MTGPTVNYPLAVCDAEAVNSTNSAPRNETNNQPPAAAAVICENGRKLILPTTKDVATQREKC
jgi:hypothetical protein